MARCIGKSFRFPAALQQGVTVSPFHGKNVIDTTTCVDLTGENVTFASSLCPVATADHCSRNTTKYHHIILQR
jgi:hypothetical protein